MNLSKYSNDFPNLLYVIRNSQNPKPPELTTFELRLKTFDSFTQKFLNKMSMCVAGYKFLRAGDRVHCFNCGLILHEWAITDDPRKEYAFHSPTCPFVLRKKGDQLVESAIRENKNVVCDCGFSHKGCDTGD
ncbi:BIR repeat [Cinara cedri]|uniref:BIR repeat n=1 Tax=Cinara cedri TaxID=506608 RepID=A0A5E4NNF7_9HEMI|nr:BIR repeat [Cinara cedri]